jgi:hypothetical protein
MEFPWAGYFVSGPWPASRRAAARFHVTSRFQQRNRDAGFRAGNVVLKLFSRR